MAITINATPKRTQRKPRKPNFSVMEDGRLYIPQLQHLFNVSHVTVYRMIERGELPEPDGRNGTGNANKPGRPFWNMATIRPLLIGTQQTPQ